MKIINEDGFSKESSINAEHMELVYRSKRGLFQLINMKISILKKRILKQVKKLMDPENPHKEIIFSILAISPLIVVFIILPFFIF